MSLKRTQAFVSLLSALFASLRFKVRTSVFRVRSFLSPHSSRNSCNLCNPSNFSVLPLLCSILSASLCTVQSSSGTESPYLYGIHDHSPVPTEYLAHITNATGAGGWITATVAVGADTNDLSGTDFTALSNANHTVICRINYGYYPDGTIPVISKYDVFA